MAENRLKFRGLIALVLLGLVEIGILAACAVVLFDTARAQVLDDRFPFLENRQRRYQQQQQYKQWNQQQWNQQQQWNDPWLAEPQRRRTEQAEPSRAPAPRRPEVAPTTGVLVFGDSMSEWLAYGLEEAFSETPEVGITRKARPNTGLIRVEQRGEAYDWPQSARDMLNAEKPDYVVIMLGTADRRGIREAIKAPPRPAAQKQGEQAKQPQGAAQPNQPAAAGQQQAAQPQSQPPADAAKKPADKPADAEAAPQEAAREQASRDPEPSAPAAAPEPVVAGTVIREFRSEEWGELYGKRVDEMIGVLKARGVPVLWVGLPSVRGARATSEMVYLNDIYRARAEKAGITYIDIWDGFVDESGNYNNYGPDYEGQTRRLRAGDGANFTRAGARKLAHYVERELRRVMQAKLSPAVATPAPEPEPEAKEAPTPAAPGLPPRPVASPVMSLTAPRGGGDTLLGGAPVRNTSADSVATRVLVKGEPIEAPAGRADDFLWPRRDVVTATGVLPPDPVEPPPKVEPAVVANPAAPATAAPAKQATAPRRERRVEQHQQPQGWQPWGQPSDQRRYEQPRQNQGFFGWFGGGRW